MNIINDFSKSIVFSNIKYNKPIKHSTYYQTDIKYNKQNMYLQSPFLKVIKNNFYENNDNSFFTISFLLLNNQNSKSFFKTIYDIEDYNCNIIHQNSKKWFGKNIPLNVLYKKHSQPWDINRNGEIILNFKINYSNDDLEDFRNIKDNDIISLKLLFKNINIYQSSFYSNWIIETFKNEDEDNIDFYSDNDLDYSLDNINLQTDKENEPLINRNNQPESIEENHNNQPESIEENHNNQPESIEENHNNQPESIEENHNNQPESIEENHNNQPESIEENHNNEPESIEDRREGTEPLLNYIENTRKKKKVKYKYNSKTSKIYRKKRVLIKIPKSRKKKH